MALKVMSKDVTLSILNNKENDRMTIISKIKLGTTIQITPT
jgi:hypothetical protein